MKRLYLIQGVPGSGKSTVAKLLTIAGPSIILSTDNLFYDTEGAYQFDSARLAEYHHSTQRLCIKEMQAGREVIIIDNCNIKEIHARPYMVAAEIYGYSVTVVSVDCGLNEAIDRQDDRPEDRRVPADKIARMYNEMERLLT